MTSGNKIKSYFFFFHLLGACVALPMSCFAQNICTNLPSGAVAGDFELSGNVNSGCSPFSTLAVDKSGGTDIRYDFYYTNKTPAQLDKIGNITPANAYFANTTTTVYTILQYGKKNGQDMYACKNVTVRPNNQPVFSYNSCNNNAIEITIPKTSVNGFDYYVIEWGDGAAFNERIDKNQLPFTKTRSLALPKTIKVEGFFNNVSLNCTSPSSTVVPFQIPSFFPNGYEDIHKVNIDEIELDTPLKAELTFHGSLDVKGYELFMREKAGVYSSIKKNVLPGKLDVILPDSTKAYCFYFSRVNTCGIDVSPELCTLPLFEVIINEKENNLRWSDYPTTITDFDNSSFGRFLNKKVTIKRKIEPNLNSAIVGLPSNTTTFTDSPIDCIKKYCYRVEMETNGQLYYYKFAGKSVSNQICVDRKEFKPPKISDLLVNVEDDNTTSIKFIDNSNWSLNKEWYYLYKEDNGKYIKLDSSKTIKKFIVLKNDDALSTSCYSLAFKDQCGSISELSPKACNVVLSLNASDNLNWTNYVPFANEAILGYKIFSFDESNNSLFEFSSVDAKTLLLVPNLGDFEAEAKFKIKAIGISGKESFSNSVVIPIQALFFLPSAFSPSSDSRNDVLEIKGRFGRVSNLKLIVYNRWGAVVAELNDKSENWDGTISGIAAPQGTYYYKLKIILTNGEKINQEGSFELFR